MSFALKLHGRRGEDVTISLNPGSSTFFVGANGSGKTRLATHAERQLGALAHRISAHRSLSLDPTVPKISESEARAGLRFGRTEAGRRDGLHNRTAFRWSGKEETFLLNDFQYLVQTLFADQANIALGTHNAAHEGRLGLLQMTRVQHLIDIWKRVLPHCTILFTGDNIQVHTDDLAPYSAATMSDGERAVFYMLGQALVAERNSVLIFDEPELHVHRAILGKLWDEVEVARPDCAFLVITHDLEFAASRPGQKFVIRSHIRSHQELDRWEIDQVPDDTGFSEQVTTLILGSRKPILFVEGTGASLDLAIYRACYPDWTVLPRGSCETVIHAVATMRHNAMLTRVTCSGIVDADDYSEEDKSRLSDKGVAVLPVSEIENLFLLPDVSTAILEEENFQGDELKARLQSLTEAVHEVVNRPGSIDAVVLRYCRRRIDRTLKKIDLSDAATPEDLAQIYAEQTNALDIGSIAKEARDRIDTAVGNADLPALLAQFDSKALLALAAKHLKSTSKTEFESWLTRAVGSPKAEKLRAALKRALPSVTAR